MLQWSKLHGFVLLCLIATTATASQLQAGAERLLPVFRNVNLVRSLNLEKSYERATVSVMIENISEEPQRSYYLAFDAAVVPRLGGLEVRDKNDASKTALDVEAVASTDSSPVQYYRVRLPTPLNPAGQQTLSISYFVVSVLRPRPSTVEQTGKQYVVYEFNAYHSSAYETAKQKTKLKLPTTDVPDLIGPSVKNADGGKDPQRQGSTFTYGPYEHISAGADEPVNVRYEFTKPIIHAPVLERDVEVSHLGGNLAVDERFWLENRAASLLKPFSRVSWMTTQYYNPPTMAMKGLTIPLAAGASDAYFMDDIGNVSTSHFRTGPRDASLELRPRFPLFGDWKYNFRIGWNHDLHTYLRKLKIPNHYVLKVPFFEGPKQSEGVTYERVTLRVILPEGSKNVNFQTSVPLVHNSTSLYRTYLDSKGRTALNLTAVNLVDDLRNKDVIVTYEYTLLASLQKPLRALGGMLTVFIGAWALSRLDTGIGKRRP